MLVMTTLIRLEAGRTEAGGPTTPGKEVISSSAEVQIHEEKVFAHLDEV
jgi:hypothetical protein